MKTTLLLSGLRAKIGPDRDMVAAYRAWQRNQMREHDAKLAAFAANLTRAEPTHGG
jgi:hypothetical protein